MNIDTDRRTGRTTRMLERALAHLRADPGDPTLRVIVVLTSQELIPTRERMRALATEEELDRFRWVSAGGLARGALRDQRSCEFVDHVEEREERQMSFFLALMAILGELLS